MHLLFFGRICFVLLFCYHIVVLNKFGLKTLTSTEDYEKKRRWGYHRNYHIFGCWGALRVWSRAIPSSGRSWRLSPAILMGFGFGYVELRTLSKIIAAISVCAGLFLGVVHESSGFHNVWYIASIATVFGVSSFSWGFARACAKVEKEHRDLPQPDDE